MPPEQVIIFIIGTVVILFGAYYVTYYVGMKASGQTRAGLRNRNIKVLDRYAIARDKQFCVIEIAGKVYIIGITNQSMTLLDTLEAAAFAKMTEDNRDTIPWHETPVGQYGNKLTKKVVAFIAAKTGRTLPPESDGQKHNDGSGGTQFAESLEKAKHATGSSSEINDSGQTDEKKTKQPEDLNPEDD